MYVFPIRLLTPSMIRPRLEGAVVRGPISIDGVQAQTANTTGGGLWRVECSFPIFTPDKIRAARAWSAYLDQGVRQFILPILDFQFAPAPTVAGQPMHPGEPLPAQDYFSEEAGYGSKLIVSALTAAAALRATTIEIEVTQGASPKGGEFFSIEHSVCGWRLYRIMRVSDADGDTFTCEIRPPLREAVSIGDAVEFDMPRLVATLAPDSAIAFDIGISSGWVGDTVSATFVESFSS